MAENDITINDVPSDEPHSWCDPTVLPPLSPVKCLEDLNLVRLRGAAADITRDPQAAFDIVQGVYERLKKWPQSKRDEIRCLEAYALGSVRNRALNWVRDRKKEVRLEDLQGADLQYITAEHADPALSVSTVDELEHLLARLPEKYRLPLLLCRMYGFDAEEAAAKLNISIAAVHKRVQRALKHLRREEPDTPPPKSRIRSIFQRKEQK